MFFDERGNLTNRSQHPATVDPQPQLAWVIVHETRNLGVAEKRSPYLLAQPDSGMPGSDHDRNVLDATNRPAFTALA